MNHETPDYFALASKLARASAIKLYIYDLYWGPEGRCIATVQAKDPRAAIRKAPQPYRKYLGELYAQPVDAVTSVKGKD